MVTKINGHRDKWSSNLPHVSSVNNKIAQTKLQNILNNAFPDIRFELYHY